MSTCNGSWLWSVTTSSKNPLRGPLSLSLTYGFVICLEVMRSLGVETLGDRVNVGSTITKTDVCGVRELIPNDEFGTVVPADDVDALSTAISNGIQDRQQARVRSEKLRIRVRQQFRWSDAKNRYLSLLQ